MAIPKCPQCDNRSFELKEISPRNAHYKYNVLLCGSCGSILGMTDYYNIGAVLKKDTEPKIDSATRDIRAVNENISNLWRWLQSKFPR